MPGMTIGGQGRQGRGRMASMRPRLNAGDDGLPPEALELLQ